MSSAWLFRTSVSVHGDVALVGIPYFDIPNGDTVSFYASHKNV
jgi:hypothetical protein